MTSDKNSNSVTFTTPTAKIESFVSDANDAIAIKFVEAVERNSNDKLVLSRQYHPCLTYQVFGESQKIAGYKNLNIEMIYTSGSLDMYMTIKYDQKMQETSFNKPDDIEGMLSPFIKHDYFVDYSAFQRKAKADEFNFKPIGEKIGEYCLGTNESRHFSAGDAPDEETVFEVYRTSFEDPKTVEYHRRLQLFLIWYVEAASYIEEDDFRWDIFLLFAKTRIGSKEQVRIVGYATAYRFYLIPNHMRPRISQFFVFPSFQGGGHGQKLYQKIFDYYANDELVKEITVEDPNPDFQRLRDTCDLKRIVQLNLLENFSLPFNRANISNLAKLLKVSKRQMERLAEVALFYLYSSKFAATPAFYQQFRLLVKSRIYRQNEAVLEGMSSSAIIETLSSLYDDEENEYKRVLVSAQRS